MCDGRRRLRGDLRCGLWNRSVPDMTDLAMVFVGCLDVPVADRMRRERSQRQNSRDGQQTFGNSFHDARLDMHAEGIVRQSPGDGEGILPRD